MNKKGKLINKSAEVDINLKYIKHTIIIFWGIFLPTKIRKQVSNTPTPLGAVGTIKPIDQDKQKITNKKRISVLLSEFTVLKQIKNPINFEKINPISNKNALTGKKEDNWILIDNLYF